LAVVEDATHEAVAIVPERAIGGYVLTRILDRLALLRGLPKGIQTDNGKGFCGKAMLTRAHRRGVRLFLIEPGKPNQNAYIDRSMVVSVTNASMRTGSRASLMHVF